MRGGHVWATPPPGAGEAVVVVYFEAPRFLEAFAGLPDVSRGEGAPTELLWAARKVNLCWRPAAASVGSPAAGLPPPPAWAARLTGACDAAPAPRAGPVPCAVVREVLGRWRLHSGWGAGGGAQGAQTEDAAEIARWDLRRGDALAAAVANALGGLALAVLAVRHAEAVAAGVALPATWVRSSLLLPGLAELEGSPLGIKLHTQLSVSLSSMTRGLLGLSGRAGTLAEPFFVGAVHAAALLSGAFGLPMALALAADALRLAALPVSLAFLLHRQLLWLQLRAARSMWSLLRGRWKNIRPGRPDVRSPEEFIVEHVIVGALLLTPLLLLLPTVALHAAFLGCAHHALAAGGPGALTAVADAMRAFPYYSLYKRFRRPGLFPAGVAISPELRGRDSLGATPPAGPEGAVPHCHFALTFRTQSFASVRRVSKQHRDDYGR